jgi:hypothetical protein
MELDCLLEQSLQVVTEPGALVILLDRRCILEDAEAVALLALRKLVEMTHSLPGNRDWGNSRQSSVGDAVAEAG